MQIAFELTALLLLIVINGMFSMAELAVAASRRPRLQQLAEEGNHGAAAALELREDPNQFLSVVQVGITLVGTVAGVFGGATLGQELAGGIAQFPLLAPYAELLGLGIVVLGISYTSLVLGELVPKRLALRSPEHLAGRFAQPLKLLAAFGVPIVHVLSASTNGVLRLLRLPETPQPSVTEEDITIALKEGAEAGVFDQVEHELVQRVFRFADKPVRALMTPRTEIVWLEKHEASDSVFSKVIESRHSYYPVCTETLDNIIGTVRAKDVLTSGHQRKPLTLASLIQEPLYLYEGVSGITALKSFKKAGTQCAVVIDEYGGVEGMLTLTDILEALVGDLPTEEEQDSMIVCRDDGSWLVDGAVSIEELEQLLGGRAEIEGDYHTVAGLVLEHLGRIPTVGERFEERGVEFEVVDIDRNRIDRVLVRRINE